MVRLAACILVVAWLVPAEANARKSHDFTHRYEQVWSAAVRMVRVDLRMQVQEQDASIGYVLFDYKSTSGRTTPGSIELVRVQHDGRPAVRVVVQVTQMPSYIEQMLVDRLGRKVLNEFGAPPAPPPRRPIAERPRETEDDENREADRNDEDRPEEGRRGQSRDQQRDRDNSRRGDRSRRSRR